MHLDGEWKRFHSGADRCMSALAVWGFSQALVGRLCVGLDCFWNTGLHVEAQGIAGLVMVPIAGMWSHKHA